MPLKCAVVGLGMGHAHALGFSSHLDARLVAVCDTDEARSDQVAAEFGCKGYTSLAVLLLAESPDIVSIATPNAFHKDLAIQAMRGGAHVLCEKPMAMNATEAREMLAVSKETGRRLMINFSFRFNDQSFFLKQQVDSGALGKIYAGRTVWHRRRGVPKLGSWFTQKALAGGGPLIDLGVHRLDLALWLMGYPKPTWVLANTFAEIATKQAASQGKEYSVEDSAFAMIRFEDGQMLELEASWAINQRANDFMETRLYGTEGGLIQHNLHEGYEFAAEISVEKHGVQIDMTPHSPIPASKSAYHHFVEAIRDDVPHTATAEEGILVMELLDAIYQSAASGAPVRL